MSRDEGFRNADVATRILDDPKFRATWRLLKDPAQQARAVSIYLATVTGSWEAGERITADEALPWWMDDPGPAMIALVEARLLDTEHRIPEHAWASWFGPAWERRERKRQGGKVGGQRSWEVRSGQAEPKDTFSTAEGELNPFRSPPVPSVPFPSPPAGPGRPAPAREGLTALGDILPTLVGVNGERPSFDGNVQRWFAALTGREPTPGQRDLLDKYVRLVAGDGAQVAAAMVAVPDPGSRGWLGQVGDLLAAAVKARLSP